MDYNDIEVSFFKGTSDKNPTRVKLIDLLRSDKYKDLIEAIRNEPDEDKRKEMKNKLPAFTPSAICEGGHALKNLVEHTGLLFLDFDYKENQDKDNFTDLPKLAKAIPHILYLGKSVSGNGYHALIPIADIGRGNHKAYYKALYREFVKCGLTPDKAASDITRLCYVSYDPDAYWNLNAKQLELDEVLEDGQSVGETLEPDPTITDRYGTFIEAVRMIERAKSRKKARIAELAASGNDTNYDKTEDDKTEDIIHFADDYHEWLGVSFAFALSFGEEMGRPLFHAYSELSDKYDHSENDRQFDEACQSTLNKLKNGTPRRGLMAVGSFFHLCEQYGLREGRKPKSVEEDFENLDIKDLIEDDEDL